MKQGYLILLMGLAVFMTACSLHQTPRFGILSTMAPSPLANISRSNSTLSQPKTAQVSPSYTPAPYTSNTPFISPKPEVFTTPTFSPTLTPLPTLIPGSAIPLVNIYMMDEDSGWGIEENGHIVHTNDGATTWDNVTPPEGAYNGSGFFALDSQTAWATPYCLGILFGGGKTYYCGGETNQTYVWVTKDGGATWLASLPICVNAGCNHLISSEGDGTLLPESIRFIDDQHGWLVISKGFSMYQNRYIGFYTSNGGVSWDFLISERTNGIISGPITALEALDERNTFLFAYQVYGALAHVGNTLLYSRSTDGGKSWNEINFAFPTNPIGNLAWDKFDCGTIESKAILPLVIDLTLQCNNSGAETQDNTSVFIHLHSEDMGRTWNYWRQTGDVNFLDAKSGWQIIAKGSAAYDLQQTTDGGLTWESVKTVTWDGILNFVNDQIGYALAYNQSIMAIMYTANGGLSWEIKSQATLSRVPCLISTWDVCYR